MYTLTPPREADLRFISKHIRAYDRLEATVFGLSVDDALEMSVRLSQIAETIHLGEEPVGAWGVAGGGCVWMVGTPQLGRHPKSFMENTWECLTRAFEVSPLLWNRVHKDNILSRRWLRRVGAEFTRDETIGGHPFKYFEIRK